MLPVKSSEQLVLKVPTGPVKPYYRESESGKFHWDPIWFLLPTGCIALIFELVAINQMEAVTSSFAWLNWLLGFALLAALSRLGKSQIKLCSDSFEYRNSLGLWLGKWAGILVKCKWSDLECIRFQTATAASLESVMTCGRGDILVFDWRNEGKWFKQKVAMPTYVNLWYLSECEKQQLFLAIARHVPQELLSPEVLYLQVKTLSGEGAAGWDDYTKVWLDEYNRKFEMPNFIALTPGSTCGSGRFNIGMAIAARVNSATYLATTPSGERVVIKELVIPIGSNDAVHKKMLEQFNREAATLAKLSHPAIVKVVDHFIENNRSYIVMEQVSGKNLREYVRLQGSLSEADALSIAQQLASVLHYLHHYTPPILHRDFTPDNLICDREGAVTVVDFGAANVFDAGKTATLIGKQKYMPPEQLRGKPSPASDIYAFGATLCFVLTGEELISMGKAPLEQLNSIAQPELCELINDCIKLDETDRPDADTVIARLQGIRNGLVLSKAT